MEGIQVDKVMTIAALQKPLDFKQSRSFLGMTMYYCRFIRGYSVIAGPLDKLTKHDEKFKWGTQQSMHSYSSRRRSRAHQCWYILTRTSASLCPPTAVTSL